MSVNLNKIKALREKLGLSLQGAAVRAGMKTRQQWFAIESGRASPTVDTLDRVAKALGVTSKDLLK